MFRALTLNISITFASVSCSDSILTARQQKHSNRHRHLLDSDTKTKHRYLIITSGHYEVNIFFVIGHGIINHWRQRLLPRKFVDEHLICQYFLFETNEILDKC